MNPEDEEKQQKFETTKRSRIMMRIRSIIRRKLRTEEEEEQKEG